MELSFTEKGEKETRGMPKCMTEEELAALYLAAEGSLNKNSKPTKEVICSLLVKMIPAIQWFTDGKSPAKGQPKKPVKVRPKKLVKAGKSKAPVVNRKPVKKCGPTPAVPEPNEAAPKDQDGTEKNKTVVDGQEDAEEGVGQNGGDGQVETDTTGDKPVCKFYDAGRCKFSKRGGVEGECPFRHPRTCRAFDRRGPVGCKSEPCPSGKMHRKVCAELLKGKCPHRVGKCEFYHPPMLSRNLEKQRKKKEEDAREKSDIKNLMDFHKQQMVMIPFFLPVPCFQYLPQFFPKPSAKG